MNYTIRPAGPEDAAGITALRRMPGVFEHAASLPSDRSRRMEELLRQPGQNRHFLVAVSPDNTVLGLVMLTVESNPRRRHSGGLGIMVRTAGHRHRPAGGGFGSGGQLADAPPGGAGGICRQPAGRPPL